MEKLSRISRRRLLRNLVRFGETVGVTIPFGGCGMSAISATSTIEKPTVPPTPSSIVTRIIEQPTKAVPPTPYPVVPIQPTIDIQAKIQDAVEKTVTARRQQETPTAAAAPAKPAPDTATPSPKPTARLEPTATPTQVLAVKSTALSESSPIVTPENIIEVRSDSTTFTFGKDVPENQGQEIQDAVNKGTKWFFRYGINLENIFIFAFSNGQTTVDYYLQRSPQIQQSEHSKIRQDLSRATAFAGLKDDFYIITTSPGWTRASPIIGGPVLEGRYHTVTHELFHVWQRKVGAYKYEPVAWMNEGIPHYLAALFLKETSMYSYEKIRNGHLTEAVHVPQSISSLESNAIFYNAGNPQTADEYSLAFLAVEYLVRDLPNSGISALVNYWKTISEGQTHQVSFKAAFGKTPADFYNEFETYRKRGFEVKS